MNRIILFLILYICFFQAYSQDLQNRWKYYLSFSNAKKVAEGGSRIYCATEGGLFYFDTGDNSIKRFSEIDGLNDYGIDNISYSGDNNVLIVAYSNSNIDLVFESKVVNLSDIKRKQITGDKSVNNITLYENHAYLSCGFGIVVINLDRREIKDTWFIGEGGDATVVNDVEIFGSYIYAATDNGILRADKENSNLPDYRNWVKLTDIPHNDEKFSHLAVHSGSLIADYTPDRYNEDAMYRLNGTNWEPYIPQINYVNDLQVRGDYMVVTGRSEIWVIDRDHLIGGFLNRYRFGNDEIYPVNPRSSLLSSNGTFFIGDYEYGLVRVSGEDHEYMYPDGPPDNKVFFLFGVNNDLWSVPGGHTDAWSNIWERPRFRLYRDDEWTEFSKDEISEMDGFFDIVTLTADPADPDHIFVGSWGGGLLEFSGSKLINRYTNHNSPLLTALPGQPDEPYVRIGGLDFDSGGNLWITNSEVSRNLFKLSPDGEWESFTLPDVAGSKNIGPVIVTENDDKWILVPRGNDAYVVDKTGIRKKRLLVTSYFNNGVKEIYTRMNDVYCIAEDLEGDIWIGTSKGIAVYNSPQRIWDIDNFYAVQPGLDLGDGLYHPLLETETVTAIGVDGANRKWIGTRGSGVYLVSENGEEEILHFDQDNSPLLSNHITSVSVNQNSGEVFFGTSSGLVSYQGDAVAGNDAFRDVYVYPNPVRETWDGSVVVTGLMEKTDVKITDIAGNLVFKTTSLGGQAVWDGNNLNGKRVKTGVYLVFCTSKDGNQTHIEKLLFIN
jgi:hypothetical protein